MTLKEFIEEILKQKMVTADLGELTLDDLGKRVIVVDKDNDGSYASDPIEVEYRQLNNEVVIWVRELA